MSIKTLAEKYSEAMLRDFHHLHQHPELSCQEKETTEYIANALREIGLTPCTDYPEYGVSAIIQGGKPGKTILLRADIDALPITEESGCPYSSQVPGVMHACGHDIHTAGLLGAARILYDLREELCGNVKLCFQPAEEVPHHGASKLVEAGILENPKVDISVGIHVDAANPLGQITFLEGPASAFGDRFTATLHGKGGHGSEPHKVNNPIDAALAICQMIQSFRCKLSPTDIALIQITKIQAGSVENVIPDTCVLGGCIRTVSKEIRQQIRSKITDIIDGVCKMQGVSYSLSGFNSDFPIVINDETAVKLAETSAEKLGLHCIKGKISRLGSEDFGWYANESGVPGVFIWAGCGSPYPAHNPRFRADERSLPQNAGLLAQIAIDYLREGLSL